MIEGDTMPQHEQVWISATEAGRILECDRHRMETVAIEAGIRRRRVPGLRNMQFHRDDVQRVASEIVTV